MMMMEPFTSCVSSSPHLPFSPLQQFTIHNHNRNARVFCSRQQQQQQQQEEEKDDDEVKSQKQWWVSSPASASPHQILGVDPTSAISAAQLKAAFRARVKEFHPDGCLYSCVQRAPYAFAFTAENGTACAISQGHNDDYQVQLAVGQCPKRCIHYVTPSQRALLDELLHRVLSNPYDVGEAALLESLIMKATFENKRYQRPKR